MAELHPAIIQVADVADEWDSTKAPHIKTNIQTLDKKIHGFFYGNLVVLTGRAGEGKSSLITQLICEALNQGENVFSYSWELKNSKFATWVDKCLAGNNCIDKKMTTSGIEIKTLNKDKIKTVKDWYRDRFYMFDYTYIPAKKYELIDIVKVVENAILVKKCRFITIDNMMMAVEAGNKSITQVEGEFVKRLKELVVKYNVIIVLVAHPRKTLNKKLENDDVSGNSNVTKLADTVLSFSRLYADKDKNCEKATAKIEVIKNRENGKLTEPNKPIELEYMTNSRRLIEVSQYKGYMRPIVG